MWHLEGLAGQTRCGRPTPPMKGMPKADWDMVLRPCPHCQRNADLPLAALQTSDTDDLEGLKTEQQVLGRHARRESGVA